MDGSGLLGGVFGIAQTFLNNHLAAERTREDRAENYRYGEMAAQNADARTRALYGDFYSPQALMRQYKAAGLSPSLMFGGTPGQGGTTGAQGTGAAGPQTPFMPLSMVDAAQAAALFAQADKTKAETKNVEQDTILKELQENWQRMQNQEKSIDFDLSTMYFTDGKGNYMSMFQIAENSYDYDSFIKDVNERLDKNGEEGRSQKMKIGTEAGQRTMRKIFMDANRYERDIKVLSAEGVNANFQKGLQLCLMKEGFAEQNAETAIKQLEAAAEAADLTKEQKSAWNNILERLRKTNSTVADVVIVASMILNQAASHWNGNVWGVKQ